LGGIIETYPDITIPGYWSYGNLTGVFLEEFSRKCLSQRKPKGGWRK